jgi:hypothetical protein
MKTQRVRTRRQLLRVTAVSAASFPFLALARKSAADNGNGNGNGHGPGNGHGNRNGHGYSNSNGIGSGNGHHCFLKGTKISTPLGDRPVQELRIGNEVQTLAGRKAIKWIGYNKFTKEEGRAWQDSVKPVRVARFAIDDHTPSRDLYLSPLHCVFVNEALIPVAYLINETSIAQGTPSAMSALSRRA